VFAEEEEEVDESPTMSDMVCGSLEDLAKMEKFKALEEDLARAREALHHEECAKKTLQSLLRDVRGELRSADATISALERETRRGRRRRRKRQRRERESSWCAFKTCTTFTVGRSDRWLKRGASARAQRSRWVLNLK
jgi:hypothetical protein